MARTARLLLALALLAAPLAVSRGYAQKPAEPPASPAPAAEPGFLQTLPRPPDLPGSLLAPAPPLGPPPPDLERPYFQEDPLLDPPELGQIGWFGRVDVGILKPHLKNQLSNAITVPLTFADGSTATVGLPAARLDWTVSPRFTVGYQLPSGFGGLALSYRFLASQGTDNVVGADGPAVLKSRLDAHVADFGWTSREYTPWNAVDMKVYFGLRYVAVYFDSQGTEPFDEAAAGTGIFDARTTNSYWGIGPDVGLDLSRRLGQSGLSVLGHLDFSTQIGNVRQGFFASSTALVAEGLPPEAQAHDSGTMPVGIGNARLGLNWQPPAYPNLCLFAGYQIEYWWNVGRRIPSGVPGPFGEFFDSGIVLQARFNY
jgi:hypothetical protein